MGVPGTIKIWQYHFSLVHIPLFRTTFPYQSAFNQKRGNTTLMRIRPGKWLNTDGRTPRQLRVDFLLSLNEDEGRPRLGTSIHYKRLQSITRGSSVPGGRAGPLKMRAHTTHQANTKPRHRSHAYWPVCARSRCVSVCVWCVCVCSIRYGTHGALYKRMWAVAN